MHVRNIWAVGCNYSSHIKELGGKAPEEPLIFLKAGSCIVPNKSEFALPFFSEEVHYEVEIALQLDKNLQIDAATIALDMTARDIQNMCKAKSLPWTMAKSFKGACPLGPFFPISTPRELEDLHFQLKVNRTLRQKGHTADMLFSPERVREYLVSRFPVCPGDIILTGTPEGISKAYPGDQIEAEIQGKIIAHWAIKK